MSGTEPGSFPLAMLMLIISVIIVFGILAASTVLVNGDKSDAGDDTGELLKGVFSFHSLVDAAAYVATDGIMSGSKLIVSSSTSILCNSYRWVHNQNDQTLEWGMNNSNTPDNIKLVATASLEPEAPILLREKGTPGSLNQWIYDNNNQTWCLKSNRNLCMFSSPGNLTIMNFTQDMGFGWTITRDLTPPACSQGT